MAKGAYIGIADKARKVKNMYVGIDGKARKVKKAYIGVGGVAKLFFTSGVDATTKNIWSSTTGISDITFSEYLNGYYILGGKNNKTAMIAYATDPEGTWTTVNLGSVGNSGGIKGIGYIDGYYVVGGT